jgi:hypothetical protein
MQRSIGALSLFAIVCAPINFATAADLPAIKSGPNNPVPACATPGRMMEYLKSRNAELDPRYAAVATEYMRLGEQLGVRWDYAFYQMIIETGSLSYRRGNRSGDVRPSQNNFAGLGATGNGEHGETFKDIATGVRAHLEHLLLYAGEHLANPVADRTRKVQEWAVLADWQAGFKRPITFSDLAGKWAPGTGGYRKMLEGVAERFQEFCTKSDPHPEMLQEARGIKAGPAGVKTAEADKPERPSGTALARRAIDDGKAQGDEQRSALGAQDGSQPGLNYKLLNNAPPAAQADDSAATQAGATPATAAAGSATRPGEPKADHAAAARPKTGAKPAMQMASAGGLVATKPPAPLAQKCRVWTASYGGQKALIIKSVTEAVVNYTVLDVNEGAENREAEAFIAAYAKNGAVAGEFVSQTQALEKAFELCPEG